MMAFHYTPLASINRSLVGFPQSCLNRMLNVSGFPPGRQVLGLPRSRGHLPKRDRGIEVPVMIGLTRLADPKGHLAPEISPCRTRCCWEFNRMVSHTKHDAKTQFALRLVRPIDVASTAALFR